MPSVVHSMRGNDGAVGLGACGYHFVVGSRAARRLGSLALLGCDRFGAGRNRQL